MNEGVRKRVVAQDSCMGAFNTVLSFYDIFGQRIATASCGPGNYCAAATAEVYFGAKLVRSNGVAVVTDRLGSVRENSSGDRFSYLPYGEERTITADHRVKFGTYVREGCIEGGARKVFSLNRLPATGMTVVRLFLAIYWGGSVASACTCLSLGVKHDLGNASVVFRGVVTGMKELPTRSGSGTKREVVTFLASRYWKGNRSREVALYTREPGTDCIGVHFEIGKEYVVFALEQESRDYWLDNVFWYGWLDILPAGSRFLTVNNFCESTAEVKVARKTIRALGNGVSPRF